MASSKADPPRSDAHDPPHRQQLEATGDGQQQQQQLPTSLLSPLSSLAGVDPRHPPLYGFESRPDVSPPPGSPRSGGVSRGALAAYPPRPAELLDDDERPGHPQSLQQQQQQQRRRQAGGGLLPPYDGPLRSAADDESDRLFAASRPPLYPPPTATGPLERPNWAPPGPFVAPSDLAPPWSPILAASTPVSSAAAVPRGPLSSFRPATAAPLPSRSSSYVDDEERHEERRAWGQDPLACYSQQLLTQMSFSQIDRQASRAAGSKSHRPSAAASARVQGQQERNRSGAQSMASSILDASRIPPSSFDRRSSATAGPSLDAADSPVWSQPMPRRPAPGEIDYEYQQALQQELRQAMLQQERTHSHNAGLSKARPVDLTSDDDPETQAERETERRFGPAHSTLSDMAVLQRQMEQLLRPSVVDQTRRRKYEAEAESLRKQSEMHQRLLKQLVEQYQAKRDLLSATIKKRQEKPKELYPPLTEEELNIADAALANGSLSDVIADAFNLRLTREDMSRLHDGEWLNDEVINFYLNLVAENSKAAAGDMPRVFCFNTFFYSMLAKNGYSRVSKWTRKVNLFEYDKVIIPIHKDVHWTLGVINFKDKRFEYYDSMYSRYDACFQVMRKYLEEEAKAKKFDGLDLSEWTNYSPSDVPQQRNGYDCGVFMCRFAANISQNQPFTFGQKHMPNLRKRMALDICTKQFSL